jgi:hypothetical protein
VAQKNDRTVGREIQLRATCVCLLCFLLQQSGEAQGEERFDEGECGMRVELSLPSARHISLSQSVWPRDLLHQSDEMKANFLYCATTKLYNGNISKRASGSLLLDNLLLGG